MDNKTLDRTFSKRILFLILITSAVLIAQGIYNIYSIDGVNKSITSVYNSVEQVSRTTSNFSLPVSELRQLSMNLVLAPNKKQRTEIKEKIRLLRIEINKTIELKNANSSNPLAKQLLQEIKSSWSNYSDAVDRTLMYVNQKIRIAEFLSVTVNEKQAYEEVEATIKAYIQYQLQASSKTLNSAHKQARVAYWAVIITTTIEIITLKWILFYVLSLVKKYVYQKKIHRKEIELQNKALVESEKMASLGRLVAGIAHELNTPIGVSVTAASCLKDNIDRFDERIKTGSITKSSMEEYTNNLIQSGEIIMNNLNRAAEQIDNFKSVAVDASTEDHRKFNVKVYLMKIIHSLQPELKKGEHVVSVIGDESLEITTNPGWISQVLTNLVMNSTFHGFDDIQNGNIRIEFKKEGNIISINYSDNGKGVSESSLKLVFEPFYTTRRNDGGTGLGMHIVKNIVTNALNGTINCTSVLGQGMQIEISFPVE